LRGKSGKKERFEAVAMPCLDAVYRMAYRLSGERHEAEDLVQETMVRAFQAFDQFELRSFGAKPWLLRILHNVFYTRAGRKRRQPTLLDDVDFDRFSEELSEAQLEDDGTSINWERVDQELKIAVQDLQPEYREVLLLWAMEELSYKEIAEVCRCAVGTVMSRLYRARQLLGRSLKSYARERNLSIERFES
jgi:RNA polymerase sigma-70 factor (ECF subfamily)